MGVDAAVVRGEVKPLFTFVSLTAVAAGPRLFMGSCDQTNRKVLNCVILDVGRHVSGVYGCISHLK